MRFGVLSAILALPCFFAPAVRSQEEGKDPGDRLLEAELLEISTGDLKRAKAVYQAIQKDERAPEDVRARALLYLARCHRKLGDIESARRILEDLVKKEALEQKILRQARSFLRELQGGRPESPDFDWLGELERNPEIQARVFDLAMDLVDTGDTGGRAYRQLLALGPIAVPVLQQVMENTRDPRHRQCIAVILLYSAHFEALGVVLDPKRSMKEPVTKGSSLSSLVLEFQKSIPFLGDRDRGRLVEELKKLPSSPEIDPYRDLLLFRAGDTSRLPEKLRRLEAFSAERKVWTEELLKKFLERDPSILDVMAGRILDPGITDPTRTGYFDFLLERDPRKLGASHWEALLNRRLTRIDSGGRRFEVIKSPYFEKLEELGSFDSLLHLASLEKSVLKGEIGSYFERRYLTRTPKGKVLTCTSPEWAPVLRAMGNFDALQLLASAIDGAIPQFVAFLRERKKKAPGYTGLQRGEREGAWAPSKKYVEAMVSLLNEKDSITVSIALGELSRADPGALPDLFPALDKMENNDLRQLTFQLLFRRFQKRPETGPRLAALLLGEFRRALNWKEALPGQPRGRSQTDSQRPIRKPLADLSKPAKIYLNGLLMGKDEILSLYPHVLALAGSGEGALFHDWYFHRGMVWSNFESERNSYFKILAGKLDSMKEKPLREAVAGNIVWPYWEYCGKDDLPRLIAFSRSVVADRGLSAETRLKAFLWQEETPWDWIDWPAFLASDDPLVGEFLSDRKYEDQFLMRKRRDCYYRFWVWVESLPEAQGQSIYSAALQSPEAGARNSLALQYPMDRADVPRVFGALLKDPDDMVRIHASRRLKDVSRADMAPLFIQLLKNERRSTRLSAIDALKRYAFPESIEPLAGLLDDPDIEIRNRALDALKGIKQTLEERNEWKKLAEKMKKEETETPKSP